MTVTTLKIICMHCGAAYSARSPNIAVIALWRSFVGRDKDYTCLFILCASERDY
jgi:hypothetical protein